MKNLQFKQLQILSDVEKKARKFKFNARFNLIVAKGKNSVGKSTVVKCLFWCLGCNPRFDAVWEKIDAKICLEFEVEGVSYWVARHGDRLFLSENKVDYEVYSKVTGPFSDRIAEILNFNVLLPSRDEDVVVVPPPAFYFLPFYIDQKHSWSAAWDSFDSLGQFSSWHKEVVEYHVGVLTKKYFDLTEDLYENKREQHSVKSEIIRFDTAIDVVNEFVPEINTTLDILELDSIGSELKEESLVLHEKQEELFERIASQRAEKAHLESQFEIASEAVRNLTLDYDFAINEEDELQCPTCGTVHDNSLLNRFSLLEDKDQAEQVVCRLKIDIDKVTKAIAEADDDLSKVREKIQYLNQKYYKEEKNIKVTLQNVLDSVAAHSVNHRVKKSKERKAADLYELTQGEKGIKSTRSTGAKSNRKAVVQTFQEIYPSYTEKLGAYGVNSSDIKSPLNYKKVAKSGGAAEGSRAMLAYYISVYNLINQYGEEVLSPLVIDTPNQHEQAAKHYQSIVKLIKEDTPLKSQIFLCGMDSEKLEPLKSDDNVHILEHEHSMLQVEQYQKIRESIGWIYELI